MNRIVIRGWASVFKHDEWVNDPVVLRTLDGLAYEDERFTDYLGGPPLEDEVAAALEPGGAIRFAYHEGDSHLRVTTEYVSRRPLADAELKLLIDYTLGQWSDGIGENWACESVKRCGYSVFCLTAGEDVGDDYPEVEVVAV